MEVTKEIYDFGQQLLDNFDKGRSTAILKEKNKVIEEQLDQADDALLKPLDRDALGEKYSKWDKIDQSLK
jgi:hypothetical protein